MMVEHIGLWLTFVTVCIHAGSTDLHIGNDEPALDVVSLIQEKRVAKSLSSNASSTPDTSGEPRGKPLGHDAAAEQIEQHRRRSRNGAGLDPVPKVSIWLIVCILFALILAAAYCLFLRKITIGDSSGSQPVLHNTATYPRERKIVVSSSSLSARHVRSRGSGTSSASFTVRALKAWQRRRSSLHKQMGRSAASGGSTAGAWHAKKEPRDALSASRELQQKAQEKDAPSSPAPPAQLPQLCQGRLLPQTETSFAVPADTLAMLGDRGCFDITDVSDNFHFRASVLRGDGVQGGSTLAMFVGQEARAPCALVGPPLHDAQTANPDSLEIRVADGSHYGMLDPQCDGSYAVSLNGQVILTIDGNDHDLDLKVCHSDGSVAARVSYEKRTQNTPERVFLQVAPRTDPVLAVTCVLAVLLLCLADCSDSVSS